MDSSGNVTQMENLSKISLNQATPPISPSYIYQGKLSWRILPGIAQRNFENFSARPFVRLLNWAATFTEKPTSYVNLQNTCTGTLSWNCLLYLKKSRDSETSIPAISFYQPRSVGGPALHSQNDWAHQTEPSHQFSYSPVWRVQEGNISAGKFEVASAHKFPCRGPQKRFAAPMTAPLLTPSPA